MATERSWGRQHPDEPVRLADGDQVRPLRDRFPCICPHVKNPDQPIELNNGLPLAVEGCPAHAYRYACQQKAAELWPEEPLQETYPGSGLYE